jgi:hypothetical protein
MVHRILQRAAGSCKVFVGDLHVVAFGDRFIVSDPGVDDVAREPFA